MYLFALVKKRKMLTGSVMMDNSNNGHQRHWSGKTSNNQGPDVMLHKEAHRRRT